MTTLFIDYEGGNDNYAGTSFALLASGTDGRITTATFSAATASFPNDGSLIGQYLSIYNGTIYVVYQITAWVSSTSLTIAIISGGTALANQAVDRQYYIGGRWKTLTAGGTAVRIVPGDYFKVMASPEPTSVGLADWTGGVSYNGVSNGSERNIQSSTNASPIVVTSATHGLVTGDTVEITGHTTNTFANGMWEVVRLTDNTYELTGSTGNGVGGASGSGRRMTTCRVMLDTACTQKIASGSLQEGAWTASANVTTVARTTDYKGSHGSAEITVAAGFATGKAAYFATGTLDLSGYEQVSFWIKQTSGTLGAANSTTLSLCSDVAGATPVNTVNIPALAALNIWYPITIDTAGALGAAIESVAFNVVTDNGAQTFRIGPIIACKAASSDDSLTFTSVIGKNTATETWFGIRDIEGTRVVLSDYLAASVNTRYSAYDGTTENVTTYKRETIKVVNSISLHSSVESGTNIASFTIEGGWDRTDMSTQSGETWYSGQGCIILTLNSNFWNADKINGAHCSFTYNIAGAKCHVGTVHGVHNTGSSNLVSGICTTIDSLFASGNPLGISSGAPGGLTINAARITGGARGVDLSINHGASIKNFSIKYMSGSCVNGVNGVSRVSLKNGVVEYTTAVASANSSEIEAFYAEDCDFTLYSGVNPFAGVAIYNKGYATTKNENGNGINKIYGAAGSVIVEDATQVHGAAAFSWKMSPVSATIIESWPLYLPPIKVALEANVAQEVSMWMRRDNTGLTMRLICKGGQIAGIAADVSTDMTAAVDTWEKVTVTLTATETGVVELEAHAFGGATYNGWVGEMELP